MDVTDWALESTCQLANLGYTNGLNKPVLWFTIKRDLLHVLLSHPTRMSDFLAFEDLYVSTPLPSVIL